MGSKYQDIKNDTAASRRGVLPKILNEIPMRTPPEEELSRMGPIKTDVASETNK
jgi:hypothetical protein